MPQPPRTPRAVLVPRKNDVLAEICRAIARSAEVREVVQESAARLQRYFGTCSVGIFFEHGGELQMEGLSLPEHLAHMVTQVEARWGRHSTDADLPAIHAMRRRQILHWDADDATLAAEIRQLLRAGNGRTLIALPIYVQGDPIGCGIVVTPEDRPLTAADEALLETALGVVGIVYRRGRLQESEAETQQRAIQTHHLTALGELAAGVAHEINNPLSTAVHYCEILLDGRLATEARDQVQAILDETLRAAATVRSLQVFARRETDPSRPFARVDDAIQAIVDLEKHQLAVSNVDLRTELEDDLPPVRVEPAHLRRVLHNLLSNARGAIAETGRRGEILVHASRVGPWVEIAVEDTGDGLSADVADRMFQPFFTTRSGSEASGLGLAVAYGLVREHGGEILGGNWGRPPIVGGEAGEGGARMVVRVAVAPEASTSAGSGAEAPAPPPTSGLTILIVEDEPQVARSVAALLVREGHRVTVAESAEEAIERLESDPAEVILSDFRMPGIGGEGLYGWIDGHHPEWMERLVFTSGDLLSQRTQAFLEKAGRPVLAKPFTLETLRAILAPFSR